MFELVVMLSRYLFIFFIVYFLWQGVAYILHARGITSGRRPAASAKQRMVIVLFHIMGYLILAYRPNLMFDTETLLSGLMGLTFIVGSFALLQMCFKRTCPLIWNGMIFLLVIGFVMMHRLNHTIAQNQILFASFGFFAAILAYILFTVVSRHKNLANLYVVLCFCLLLLPFFFGSRTYGALRWITIGPVTFQPSEVAKFFYIFYLSAFLSKKKTVRQLIPSAIITSCIVLILVIQRGLGDALIFFMTYLVMVYIATGNFYIFFGGVFAGSIGSMIAYQIFEHVQIRVLAWRDPWSDPFNRGLQILQSLFAIGSWGLLGSGLSMGAPYFVPVVISDFIFSAISEEFGGLFGLFIIGIFMMIFYRSVNIALRSKSLYFSLLAAGFTAMLAFQTFLILGGVIKLIPMTGVTLPFVSAGGSSLIVSVIMIGILQKIGADCKTTTP